MKSDYADECASRTLGENDLISLKVLLYSYE